MFLDKDNTELLTADEMAAQTPASTAGPYEAWKHFPHSYISHHGAACCETAREWFLAMDYATLGGESTLTGPRWIRARYNWGPSAHPIHWCEAVKRKTLDCGALAALAHECFLERGLRSFPVQLVQRYSTDAAAHWESRWAGDEVSTHWINDDVIYHEGCAVLLPGGDLQIWDASAAWWINPLQTTGYGSLAALRIWTGDAASLRWGKHRIPTDKWTVL